MDSPLSDMWKKIKHWYWWNFKATEFEKTYWDTVCSGTGFMKRNFQSLTLHPEYQR